MSDWGQVRRLFSKSVLGAIAAIAACVAFASPAPAQAPAAASVPDDKSAKPTGIVATVNGIPIFRRDVDRDVTNALQGQKLPPDQLARVQAAALQGRIDALLKQTFLNSQQISASKEEVDATLEQ